jgi:amino acid transporter
VNRVSPVRLLGRGRLVAVGINSVVGGGIFVLPATVAGLVGPGSFIAYLAAAGVVLGVGWALARLAARYESSGGPYLYVHRVFGPLPGFQVGWLFCLARLTAMANLLHAFALYLGALVPSLARPLPQAALVLACAAAVIGVNIAGIRQTSGVTDLAAVLKIGPLVVLGLAGLAYVRAAHFVPGPVEPASFLRAVLLLIFAYSGFEILTVPAEEALQPRRDMPAALIITIVAVASLYMLVQAAAAGLVPDLAGEKAPLASAAARLAGLGGRVGMTGVAALSIATCSLASLLGATRILYAMASAGEVPSWMGALHPRFRTPAVGTMLVGGAGAALAIFGGYAFLAAVSVGTRLLTFLACTLACMRKEVAGSGAARLSAAITSAAIAVLLFGLERRELWFGMIGIGVGFLLYLLARRGRAGRNRHGEAV